MKTYRGLTMTELIVVLAIIAALLSLLLPALISVRERARETACKNNLRQMHVALLQFVETAKELPPKPAPGEFGGWMVAILPSWNKRVSAVAF